jgi:hypothetical protein
MNTLTRAEGYRLNGWKGAEGEAIFEDFLSAHSVAYTKLEDKTDNMVKGDYETRNNIFEVKSQPIGKYAQNFVELGEITNKQYHSEGYNKLETLLAKYDITLEKHLQHIPFFNFALTPVSNGATMVYINRETKLLYLYGAEYFLQTLTNTIKQKGIQKALGRSNMASVSAFCENSKVSFQKKEGEWLYTGNIPFEKVETKYLGGK